MVTTTAGIMGNNNATNKVMNYMLGVRTKKQIVGEFFGLRQEAIYDDDGENIIDYINDFKDTDILKSKSVGYNKRLGELGVSEQDFNSLFNGKTVNFGKKAVKVAKEVKEIEATEEDGITIEEARKEYKEQFGKKAHPKAKLETILAKLK